MGELSQVALASGASLWIAPLASPGEYAALQDVVARLRAPDGCPWDRELTWVKMRASVLEEAHELLDALDADDPGKVAEELGDLLLQVALLTQIATEEGRFRFPEVVAHIVAKLIRRHPHVFGDAQVSGTDEVLANWEAIKRAERAAKAGPPTATPRRNARRWPASRKACPRWRKRKPIWIACRGCAKSPRPTRRGQSWPTCLRMHALTPELVGEVLFDLVAWSRARGVESESALRDNQRALCGAGGRGGMGIRRDA